MENINDIVFNEAISLTEALVAKSFFNTNCKILISPGVNPGETFLIITVQDTIMYKIPMRNDATHYYGAGSGIHMNGFDIYDPYIVNGLLSKYNEYNNFIGTNLPIAQDDELRSNEDFEKLLGLKSDQGLKFYNLPNFNNPGETYLIPMFAGFISLNKSDRIGVKIYDLDDLNHLIKFDIYKKKINRNVEMICRVLKI